MSKVSYEVEYTRLDGTIGSCTGSEYQGATDYYISIGYTINHVVKTVFCDHCDNGTRQAKNTRNQFKRVRCEHCKGKYILSEEKIA